MKTCCVDINLLNLLNADTLQNMRSSLNEINRDIAKNEKE